MTLVYYLAGQVVFINFSFQAARLRTVATIILEAQATIIFKPMHFILYSFRSYGSKPGFRINPVTYMTCLF